MVAMEAEMNRKLRGWYGYFKHADPGDPEDMDFAGIGLFCLLDAQSSEAVSLRNGATH